jgi:hypothetical protein
MERAMNPELLVESELSRTDWSRVTEATGPATGVPLSLRELFSALSPDEVTRAYWKLENHVVVQGQLFEAAIHVVPVLLAALATPERPRFVRIGILELLFQIVNGVTHEDERNRGLGDIDARCKMAARYGLWLLYREVLVGEKAAAIEVLRAIDDNETRLSSFKQAEMTH